MVEEERGLSRIGVSLASSLLNKFDRIIRGRGYSSRSEGIRDAIRAYIVEYEWMEREAGDVIGTITCFLDSSQRGLMDKVTEAESRFRDMIKTATHFHLDEENCFKTVVMGGEVKRIKEFADNMMSLKGVKHVDVTITHKV